MSRYGYVLIVDDERDIREAVAEMLVHHGHDVKLAANGREALELARTSVPPRLILLDLMMPVMDGLEFNRVRWADPGLRGIPVCVMTASDRAVEVHDGIVSVLRKPFDTEALLEIIDRFC